MLCCLVPWTQKKDPKPKAVIWAQEAGGERQSQGKALRHDLRHGAGSGTKGGFQDSGVRVQGLGVQGIGFRGKGLGI